MKQNEELQKDVQDALKWEPLLKATEIGVIVKNGVVTLTGTVDSYTKKLEAEHAAKNVAGVKAVVEKIEIVLDEYDAKKTDGEIAEEVLNAIRWSWIPNDKIMVKVEKGWVTLEGELQWKYQKDEAQKVVNKLMGVKGVINNITLKIEGKDEIEQKDIERALARNWSMNDQDIKVKVTGAKVTLKGVVHSWYQKEEAERIAWNAPGVWNVDNELVIEFKD